VAQDRGARGLNGGRRQASAAVRCFVALQPDETARERLDQLAREQHRRFPSARRMRRDNLHLTLAFIGALPPSTAQDVAGRVAALPVDAFAWRLDAIGAFGGARVLWAGGAEPRLDALAQRCRGLLEEMAVRFDRKAFVAHVTLLRNVPRTGADLASARIEPPILWRVEAPLLMQSTTDVNGTRYTPVALHGGNG
jgi:2'-5' RNA ligase